jgi:hypothetical protein
MRQFPWQWTNTDRQLSSYLLSVFDTWLCREEQSISVHGRGIRREAALAFTAVPTAHRVPSGEDASSASLVSIERTDPFRSAVPIDPDQWFRLIPITDSG